MAEAGFDIIGLRDKLHHFGRVLRIVIASDRGSTPRESGAAMLVWQDGQTWGFSGTIGGGALEYHALEQAKIILAQRRPDHIEHHALGPSLGQCCGGALQLLYETWDLDRLAPYHNTSYILRPLPGRQNVTQGNTPSLAIQNLISKQRSQGLPPKAQIIDGWIIEPVLRHRHQLWVWGAGHVGRALIHCLAPLPDWQITWVDQNEARFPADIAPNITPIWADQPENLVSHSQKNAHHVVLTYSHSLDLAICHRLLIHDFLSVGLIGSATKWARFRTKLAHLGHSSESVAQITCPIGTPEFGKHPQAIALGVAVQLLNRQHQAETETEDDTRRDASANRIPQRRSSVS